MNKLSIVVPDPYVSDAIQVIMRIDGITPVIQDKQYSEIKGETSGTEGEYPMYKLDFNEVTHIALQSIEYLAFVAEIAIAYIEIRKFIKEEMNEKKEKENEKEKEPVHIVIHNQIINIPADSTKQEIEIKIKNELNIMRSDAID